MLPDKRIWIARSKWFHFRSGVHLELSTDRRAKGLLAALISEGLAAQIVHLKRQLGHRKEMLLHVDATLRLLDHEIKVDSIRPERAPIKLFRQGGLGRLIIDAIRRPRTVFQRGTLFPPCSQSVDSVRSCAEQCRHASGGTSPRRSSRIRAAT